VKEAQDRFRQARPPSTVVSGWLPPDEAEALRQRLTEAGFQPIYEPCDGRFGLNTTHQEPELFERLHWVAAALANRPLALVAARWTRHEAGDYCLSSCDLASRAIEETHIEVLLDFSADCANEGEVTYTDGQDVFVAPQRACSVAVVERAPSLRRWERYLTRRSADMQVFRLRISLAYSH